uniref:Deoxyribonuclease II n=1 Tax=Rhabditophanes sp. KR3021 TaxID=114890 RepID=A0AC35U7T2_9BILA
MLFYKSGLLLALSIAGANAFSCQDQNGKDVDWFASYKMPKIDGDNSVPGISDGHAFYYLDSNNPALTPSPNSLSSNNQAIALTLKQYYDRKDDSLVAHVMYNDEIPDGVTARYTLMEKLRQFRQRFATEFGHTKGVVFFDGKSGVWLVHSVPKFPMPDSYSYPDSGTNYGQSFLCMTFDGSQLAAIGTQLLFNHPQIYSSKLPTAMVSGNPDLASLIGGNYNKGAPYTSTKVLKTKAGAQFTSFAKNGDFGKDLYDGLVAPGIKTALDVETWRRGKESALDCSTAYEIADILTLQVGSSPVFKYTKDHSKLAISSQITSPYVCIGDINRMTTQYERGGGTICFKNQFVWNSYSKIPQSTKHC